MRHDHRHDHRDGRDGHHVRNHTPKGRRLHVRSEDIREGDMLEVLGLWVRVVKIRPYHGPHAFIFAIAETMPERTFSMERGTFENIVR